jgi:two-component system chemotaxis response regulator CheY
MKILVVDDMSTMRKIIKNMLTQIGFTNIAEADDGATAWPMIQSAISEGKPYEFILSDWNMPQMSGLDLLKNVRSTPGLEKLPFLMITAEAEQGNVVIAVREKITSGSDREYSRPQLEYLTY